MTLGGPALPAADAGLRELDAPPSWRRIDFISDVHLAEAMPRTFAALQAHLQHTPADAVLLLGDLFELWVGDDARHQAFERRCVDMLAQAAARRPLYFMHGNRDFLVGPALCRDAGLCPLADPCRLHAFGRRVLLSHGDALCLADTAYQGFRAQVRGEAWQREFLARPLAQRQAIAREIRAASEARRRFDGDGASDVDAAEAARWLDAADARTLVHGHTHRPGSDSPAPGLRRWVLSDWDLDGGQRAEVLVMDADGFRRIAPTQAPGSAAGA